MILEAKMLLKINKKGNEILNAFLKDFQREITKNIQNNSVPVTRRWVPGILNLPRIRLHTFSHALLPQRGAADRRRLTATHRRPPSFGLASLRHCFFPDIWPSK